jgi:murein L,D-transpeptidase YcbB/YkuD
MACLSGIAVRWLPADHLGQRPLPPPSTVAVASGPAGEPQLRSSEKAADLAIERLKQEIRSYDQNDTHVHAFNAIAEQWGTRPIKVFTEGLDVPDMFRRIAARRNLRVTLFKGSLDNAIRFNLPFLVVTGITGELGEYCYAVTSVENGTLSISPTLFETAAISRNDLASIANGAYYLVWQNFGQIPDSISMGEKRYEIRALQRLLKQAGYYQDLIDGDYSSATARAVREFQQSMGITANDTLGELTLAALSRFDTNHKVPSLKGN